MFMLLLIIAIVMWLDGFIFYSQTQLQSDSLAPLYGAIAQVFQEWKFLSVSLSFLFMILQAFMFNRVIADKNLVDRNSWLPALLYIVLMSFSFNLFGLHPVWFANFFLILALDKMFEVFKGESANIEIFNIGFFVSLASLFYFPALTFIFLIISALFIYYLVRIKEILASIIGLALPYIFVALYYYWFDMLEIKVDQLQSAKLSIELLSIQIVPFGWISIIIVGATAMISIMRIYLGSLRDKPIRIRNRYYVLLLYFIIAILTAFLAGKSFSIHYGIIMLPLAAIIAGFFQVNKRALFNEIIFSLLILLILLGKLARIN
jgi:hypothetical protein